MSLTGTAFLGLVLVATATAFAVVVWRWGTVAGPDPRSVALRVARLAGLNLMVLLCAGVALNHVYLFYADWTDLLGATGLGAASRTLAAGGAPSGALGGLGEPVGNNQYRLPLLPRGVGPGRRVLYFDVTGPASGITGEVMVVLPRTYREPTEIAARYPVLEAFHGYPGNPEQMLHPFTLQQDVDAAAARDWFADALIVAPELEFPLDADTECANGPAGYPQVETWVAEDVPTWVEHTFRVRTDRAAWATIGLSEGGWCAAMTALRHPARYSAAIVLGGYFRPEFSGRTPFPVTPAMIRSYDLVAAARAHPPPVLVWLETSHSDPVSYPSSKAFLGVAAAPLSVHALVLSHAGHRMSLWDGVMPAALAWLGAADPAFA